MNSAQAAHAAPPATSRADLLLEAQAGVLELIGRGGPLPEILDAICRIAESLGGEAVRAAILLVGPDGRTLWTGAAPSLPASYCQAIDGIAISADVGTCCAAAARNEVVVTRCIASDRAWKGLGQLPLGLGLRAAWSMPIVSSTGDVLGTFGTYFLEAREPTSEERRLVAVLARTAALAIERRRADEALRASARRDRFLAELAAATQPLGEPSEVMATTSRMLAEHLDVDRCAYAEVEEEKTFVITGDYTRGVPSIVGRWPVAAFGPGCVRRMLTGEPFVVADVESHPDIAADHRPAYQATNIRAVICVPLHKDGKLTAAMAVHQTSPRSWSAAEVELVTQVVARCWEALERARVTRELRESEARHRAIVQASPECVKIVAPDGRLLQMNAAGLRMIEADESRAIGGSVYDVIAPEHRDAYRAFNERVCRGEGGSLTFDIVGLRGTRRAMETTAVALPAPSGGFTQLAVTRDVSARVAADRALAESRGRLDYAVRLSGVGFWYCDLPFQDLVWDARVKEHFFFPPEARVTIDLFYERLHPEDREATRTAIESSIRENKSYDVVYRTVDPSSGAVKWIRALGGTAYAPDGTPTRFDGVTVDVTVQKLGEERLARVLDGEREQGRLLKRVAHAALTIHASSSLDSVLQVTTEEARAIIGARRAVTSLTSDEQVSAKAATGPAAPPTAGDAERVCRTNRPLRMTRAELAAHAHYDEPARDEGPPGGWLAAPFVGRNGANLGLIQLWDKEQGEFSEADEAIVVQLAQIAGVAIENVRLCEELREQDRRKDDFLATLAHELRNPLAPIRTGLQVLRLTQDPAQAGKTRAVMERQLGHLVRMVDDLLDLSRVTLGKLTLKKELVDFRTVVESALETTRPLVDAGQHELVVELPAQPLPLLGDPTRLAQVVANLVNNAAKYTPPHGRIALSVTCEPTELVVRVSDNGIGIPDEMVAKVFEMFTQVSQASESSHGGLGVGLTLVRRLVEMHGGSVVAQSPGSGRGSTFTVRLPSVPAASRASTPATSSSAVEAGPATLRVLVVDDNVDGAESLATLLALNGHKTRVAHSGPDALSAAAEFAPEIIFLDIGLPGIDGYEVARRLRADTTVRQPFLVALTGWGTAEDQRRAHAAGFDRHLVKPVDVAKVDALLATVRPNG